MPGYISEILYMGDQTQDFIELALPQGTDVSGYSLVHYNQFGAIKTTYTIDTYQATMNGQDVYLFNDTTTTFQKISEPDALALVDDTGTVLQFISFGGTVTATTGPANGLTSAPIGTSTTTQSLQSTDGGASYAVSTTPSPGTIPCYAPGTLIDTPDGPRAVETLAVGDLVDTLDHGPMPIRWVSQQDQPLEGVDHDNRPILIRQGAFGHACPARDLVVSPQHRILVGAVGQLDGLFDGQCFAPAKALLGLPRIRAMMGRASVTWVHFALDSHEVVRAEGCYSESLLLGPMVLSGLSAPQRCELIEIYGASSGADPVLNGPAARDCLTVGAVRRKLKTAHHAHPARALAA